MPRGLFWPRSGGGDTGSSGSAFVMGFDLLAPHCRWMEFVLAGQKLQRCRTAFLDEVAAPKNILLVGEGHGRALVECCRRFCVARIVCLDASERMLNQARERLAPRLRAQVEFIHADILQWEAATAHSFDLIVTNFFLDCFRQDQLNHVINRLALSAAPGADWLLSDFQVASSGMTRIRSRVILWAMYIFFRVVTRLSATRLIRPDPLLKAAGFDLHRRLETEWGLLHSDWWREQGVPV
jgi:SAM-dependent methyltransferase